jgi:hypothetical protein
LAVGELAFNEQDGGLYIGRSNGSVIQINGAVGGGGGATISDTPPGSPTQGQLWWESDTGKLYVSYNDGNTTQWIGVTGGINAILPFGTPVDNQIAVWTDATHVEGATNFTFDGATLRTPGLRGSDGTASATAGDVGEYQQALLGAATTPTVSVITTIMSLALTAGDWDVWYNGMVIPTGASGCEVELTTGSTLSGLWPNYQYVNFMAASSNNQYVMGPLRFLSASSFTVSHVVRAGASGQQFNKGLIAARRRR